MEPELSQTEPAAAGPTRSVLIVDDEESVLRALRRSLKRQGWDVQTALSGEEGLQVMERSPAQVVVSDFKMPGMTGVEFLRVVKDRFPAAQRVMLTGYADQQAVEEAINRSEVFRFLTKPWDDAQLQATLASAYDQFQLQEENRRLLALTLRQNVELVALAQSLERKVEERTELLARAKSDWEKTFDAIDRPIAVLERDLHIVRANRAYAAMARCPVTQVAGARCYERLFGRSTPCPTCPLGRGERPNLPVEHFEGERSFSMNCYEAAEQRVVCIYRETTEERMLTRRMLQTEKLAAVGQLAAGVAHEINNPLGGILAFTQLMLRDAGRSAQDLETLRDIEHAALRTKRIVESLLKFSRRAPSGGHLRLDLHRAVEDAIVLFRSQLKGKPQAVFHQELCPDALPVSGDSSQIEQVILNLLVNALQALRGGTGRVVLRTRRQDGFALLQVEDDGVGIAPENLHRIFEPTFTTKPPGEGTGFGLAISWNIAETHGGTIEVGSTLGQGSTFTLRLPLIPSADAPTAAT